MHARIESVSGITHTHETVKTACVATAARTNDLQVRTNDMCTGTLKVHIVSRITATATKGTRFMTGKRITGIFAVVAASGLIAATPALGADASLAAPPSVDELSSVTTALLYPGDVPGALGGGGTIDIGYYIPPGGQDPTPMCFGDNSDKAIPPLDGAIGYYSTAGQVSEDVYVYSSVEAAQSAWATFDRGLAKACSFVTVDGKDRERARTGMLRSGSQVGRWVRMETNVAATGGMFSVAGPADNAIVVTRYMAGSDSKDSTADQRAAMHQMFDVLSDRYANRNQLNMVQPPPITQAEQQLLQPADIPASLPILAPENGAWASFRANLPGTQAYYYCAPLKDKLPVGTGTFDVSYGGQGDIFTKTGKVYQWVMAYESAEAAQAAWQVLSKNIRGCDESVGKLFAEGSNRRTTTGSLELDGMPALWTRGFDTEGYGKNSFSNKDYTVYMLDGSSIVSVGYNKSLRGLKNVPIDQAAVNELAVFAAQKWQP